MSEQRGAPPSERARKARTPGVPNGQTSGASSVPSPSVAKGPHVSESEKATSTGVQCGVASEKASLGAPSAPATVSAPADDATEEGLINAAQRGFAALMQHICTLYTCGDSSSVSAEEGAQLAASALYVLGIEGTKEAQRRQSARALSILAREDVVAYWGNRRVQLESRVADTMGLWQEAVATLPALRNIALRDTLASIEKLPRVYDSFFAAHEVPVSIDYPLSVPVSEQLQGLDYLDAWLTQLIGEARFLARFDVDAMRAYLESWCPDHQGLLINLYEPIFDAWSHGVLSMKGEKLPDA